jgi:uncharacterized protein (DUF488 family)
MNLFTLGYSRWPTQNRLDRILAALREAEVTTLIDIRHSPCPSNRNPQSMYGPRPWHLLDAGNGVDGHLERAGIEYIWLGELGNPRKNDPAMTVLRSHIAEANRPWPVNRGICLLNRLVRNASNRCCLLCACKDYNACHRKLIAEALSHRFFAGALCIQDLF